MDIAEDSIPKSPPVSRTGIVEEVVFRGFIMTALERRWNRWAAVLLPSVLFGLVHITLFYYEMPPRSLFRRSRSAVPANSA